jgi:hypothetical protein
MARITAGKKTGGGECRRHSKTTTQKVVKLTA